jgi:hypothetical protein
VCFSLAAGDVVSTLEMYSDESESTNPPLVLIGGWISEMDLWAELSVEWKTILARHGVDIFMHVWSGRMG